MDSCVRLKICKIWSYILSIYSVQAVIINHWCLSTDETIRSYLQSSMLKLNLIFHPCLETVGKPKFLCLAMFALTIGQSPKQFCLAIPQMADCEQLHSPPTHTGNSINPITHLLSGNPFCEAIPVEFVMAITLFKFKISMTFPLRLHEFFEPWFVLNS